MSKTLSKKEIKELQEQVRSFGIEFSKKDLLVDEGSTFSWNKLPAFFRHEQTLLPTLKCVLQHSVHMPSIFVDKGAIPFIIKGADIMRPGITSAEPFPEKSYILIRDETYKKPLAIGYSELSSEQLLEQHKGKLIKSLHYVGDHLWQA